MALSAILLSQMRPEDPRQVVGGAASLRRISGRPRSGSSTSRGCPAPVGLSGGRGRRRTVEEPRPQRERHGGFGLEQVLRRVQVANRSRVHVAGPRPLAQDEIRVDADPVRSGRAVDEGPRGRALERARSAERGPGGAARCSWTQAQCSWTQLWRFPPRSVTSRPRVLAPTAVTPLVPSGCAADPTEGRSVIRSFMPMRAW